MCKVKQKLIIITINFSETGFLTLAFEKKFVTLQVIN